jgi:predicted MFS family arabinose efflux permease
MICYGVADTIGSYGFGYVIKFIGRIPCFLLAALLNYLTICIMIFWSPNQETSYILFVVAILWGLGDAV